MLALLFTFSCTFLGLTLNNLTTDIPPEFLYKIVTIDDWVQSQPQAYLILPPADSEFVHLSTAEQLPQIIQKYWYNRGTFYVLKIRSIWLEGKLVKETNPGGKTEYYHLYGKVPISAIVDSWQTAAGN